MSGKSGEAAPDLAIDLARVADFHVGNLLIQPSLRRAGEGARALSVEPRVMQALVALMQAAGGVVSRDRLIERCWSGRIVGDDAINRCIAKVRRLAELAEPAPFIIETVARVGYRLEITPLPPAAKPSCQPLPPPAAATPPRRAAGPRTAAAIAIATAAAATAWLFLAQPAPPADRMTLRIDPFTCACQPGSADLASIYTQSAIERLSQHALLALVNDPSAGAQAPLPRYILSGKVETDGARVKIAVQLAERPTGHLLLVAQTYQPAQAGPAASYATMTRLLAGVEKHMRLAEFARYAGPPRDVEDLVLHASVAASPYGPNHDPAAMALGEQALAQDPASLAAKSVMAALLYNDALASDAMTARAEGRRALALTESLLDRWPHNLIDRHLRASLLALTGNLPAARVEAESALAEEPGNPGMLLATSAILLQLGDVAGSTRLLPPGPDNTDGLQAAQLFALGRYDEALETTRRGDLATPPNPFDQLLEAAILTRLNRLAPAHAIVASVLPELRPELRHASALQQVLFSLPDASWHLVLESLLTAGMPA